MSVHKECGEDIRWALRDDQSGRYNPPLEFVGHMYVIDSDTNVAKRVTVWQPHNCDPEKMLAWQEYRLRILELRARGAEIAEGLEDWKLAQAKREEETWNEVLKYECRRCEAPIDEKCRNMGQRFRKTGEIVHVKHPHTERMADAGLLDDADSSSTS